MQSRMDILKIHSRKMNLVRGIDLKKIAEGMNGASGAETKAVCTEAGMFALRERRVHITQEDFEMAVAKARGRLLGSAALSLRGESVSRGRRVSRRGSRGVPPQVMKKDSDRNISIKKLWK